VLLPGAEELPGDLLTFSCEFHWVLFEGSIQAEEDPDQLAFGIRGVRPREGRAREKAVAFRRCGRILGWGARKNRPLVRRSLCATRHNFFQQPRISAAGGAQALFEIAPENGAHRLIE